MKKVMMMFAVATAAMTYGADAEDGFVRVRENVMPVRDRRDLWAVGGGNGSFAYTNGEGRVSFKGDGICLYHSWAHPGPERLGGAAEYVLRTEPAFEGDVTLTLRREEKDHGTNVFQKVTAKWVEETRFAANLDAHDHYYLDRLDFRYKRTPETRSFRFGGIDAVTQESPAEALRVDVETGNPLHIVRDGKGEKAVLVLRNPSDRKLDWNVHLKVEDFFGRCIEGDFPVSLEAGGELRRPMKEALPKGIRYVTVVAACGGQAATNRTTWACLDTHEVTPLQPEDEFRLGVNFHGLRYSRVDSNLGMDALVAIGAKMVRNEATLFPGIWQAEDKIDWKTSDDYLDRLERHGLAVDSIVWWPAGW
ncbi:MAG: hypothetical protein KBT68_02010, partial [bacterium]|nr:hypothetical protein [Candidatus Colisoma equi]